MQLTPSQFHVQQQILLGGTWYGSDHLGLPAGHQRHAAHVAASGSSTGPSVFMDGSAHGPYHPGAHIYPPHASRHGVARDKVEGASCSVCVVDLHKSVQIGLQRCLLHHCFELFRCGVARDELEDASCSAWWALAQKCAKMACNSVCCVASLF